MSIKKHETQVQPQRSALRALSSSCPYARAGHPHRSVGAQHRFQTTFYWINLSHYCNSRKFTAGKRFVLTLFAICHGLNRVFLRKDTINFQLLKNYAIRRSPYKKETDREPGFRRNPAIPCARGMRPALLRYVGREKPVHFITQEAHARQGVVPIKVLPPDERGNDPSVTPSCCRGLVNFSRLRNGNAIHAFRRYRLRTKVRIYFIFATPELPFL